MDLASAVRRRNDLGHCDIAPRALPTADGAVLGSLFTSVPADSHQPVLDRLAEVARRSIAVHDVRDSGGPDPGGPP